MKIEKLTLNSELENYFSIIIEELKFLKPSSIIVYGSYGRNEGAWIVKKSKLLPYNDFDIIVISEKNLSEKHLKKLSNNIQSKINIKWIDLKLIKRQEVKEIYKKTIFNYDFKFGSTVIYGDKNILNSINIKSSDKIDINDLEVLFNTRLWTFYGSYEKLVNLNSEDSMFFKYQMAKAILASVDSFLVRNNIYHHKYEKKVQLFLDHSSGHEKLVKWALKEKMRPTSKQLKDKEAIGLLEQTKKIFFDEFFISLSLVYKQKIVSIEDIIQCRNSFSNKLKYFLKYIFKIDRNIYKKNSVKILELALIDINNEKNLHMIEPIIKESLNTLDLRLTDLRSFKKDVSIKRFNL